MDSASAHNQRQHYMSNMHSNDPHASFNPSASPSLTSNSTITSPMIAPQSPNTQLTMNLLNNLLQMQGLDNTNSHSQQQQQQTQTSPSVSSQQQTSQLLLEHQIKLNQLQQLQQLQQQIFQQQIALISGQSPTIMPGSGNNASLADMRTQMGSNDASSGNHRESQSFSGLPTPGPSGEIRPQQNYGAGSGLGNFVEPLPRPLIPPSPSSITGHGMQQHHRHSSGSSIPTLNPHLQRQQQQAMSSFSQTQPPLSPSLPHITHPTSPVFHPQSTMHNPSRSMSTGNSYAYNNTSNFQRNLHIPDSNFGHQMGHYLHPHPHGDMSSGSSNSPISAPHSAPEHLAFNIYRGPTGMTSTRSPLTPSSFSAQRPEKARRKTRKADGSNSNSASASPGTNEQDMDISPLTSPWLGATPAATITSNNKSYQSQQKSNKRAASISGDEGNARKKQSPAIGPTLGMTSIRTDVQSIGGGGGGGESSSVTPPHGLSRSPDDVEGSSRQEASEIHNFQTSFSSATTTGTDVPRTSKSAATSPQIVPSGTSTNSSSTSGRTRSHHRGSKSTNSTPLLRSTVGGNLTTRTRSKSRAGAGTGTGTGATSSSVVAAVTAISDTPSPIDLAPDHTASASNLGSASSNVDSRSMPPPPLPSSVSNKGINNNNNNNDLSMSLGMSMETPNFTPMMDLGNLDMSMNMENMGGVNNFNMDFMDMNMGNMQSRMNHHHHHGHHDHLGDMGMGGGGGAEGEGSRGGHMDFDMSFGSFQNLNGAGEGVVMRDGDMHFGQQRQGEGHQQQQQQQRRESTSAASQQQQQSLDQNQNQSHHQHHMSEHSSQAVSHDSSRAAAQQQPLTPVTPASLMNINMHRSSRPATAVAQPVQEAPSQPESTSGGPMVTRTRLTLKATPKAAEKEKGAATSTTTARGGRPSKKATHASPSLKAILPAGSGTPIMDGSMPGTPSLTGIPSMEGSMSGPAVPLPERKNNHKFAEQKRRDSMKNTFDDLRKLLPPIALPTDPNINLDDPSLLSSPLFHPTAPLLPGALPPRGPPKAGGEGPNKGVSKLQLLICGNEYIRLLKGRVDRRDEEIQKLRGEIRRLRGVYGGEESEGAGDGDGNNGGGDQGDVIDLDKDLDAVERQGYANSREIGASSSGDNKSSRLGASSHSAEDGMDEGDDEGDD